MSNVIDFQYLEALVQSQRDSRAIQMAHMSEGFALGAAVAFGLMGMAEAIAAKHWLEACPGCGRASGSRTYEMPSEGNPWARNWLCISCDRARRAPLSPGMNALRRLWHFGKPTPEGGYR
ncbi:MAG TPA: hypothetical protein VM430_08225 [Microbacterium sp.]|jgi:hypothetical protein|nr:hypothetical protein [Microbacterium sp.]